MAEEPLIAVFVDFENLALGVRDMAGSGDFEVKLVLKRLLEKGRVVHKRAYCDWGGYRKAMREFHEQGIEMIDIPHSKMSGKNSADIHMVVDAMDLCSSKGHIDLFALITGDSDFSPLVSKLKENDKRVVGCGVKQSTSDLLIANCDEFIYYDDLVQENQRSKKKKAKRPRPPANRATPRSDDGQSGDAVPEDRRQQGMDHVLDTVERLFRDRDGKIHGSMVKQSLKRRRPNFSETFHGYRTFNEMLEDAEKDGLLKLDRDDKGGGFFVVDLGPEA